MSRLRVHNFLVTLDGFATGEDQSTEAAFGTAQAEFLAWFEKANIFRPARQQEEAVAPPSLNESIAAAWSSGIGADIMGRNMFRPTVGPWPDDAWRGWWGEEPPFGTPCFVLTHWEREPLSVGRTTFHFVASTPADVLQRAQEAACGLDVLLGGGPTTVKEFLSASLVDYLHVIQIPIVLGRGVRLWDGLESLHKQYAVESATMPNGTTHFFFTKNT